VVTGSRAEYGLLYWLMKEIDDDPSLELQVLVTGMHLEKRFGLTVETIVNDGFNINARVSMDIADDTPETIAKSIGIGIVGMTDALIELTPDCVVVLGDRYEMLAAGQTAMALRIPLAHIHGGEATEGLIDEAIRHALTKLSQIHFVAADEYRNRVIQMGEQPSQVHKVGAACLDNLEKLELISRQILANDLEIDIGNSPFFLVTYHPVTLNQADQAKPVQNMLEAMSSFPDHKYIITGVNSDPGNNAVARTIKEFAGARPKGVIFQESLGQLRYMSAMKYAAVVIGNSSSGIIEAPAMKVPTVNIGERQQGRIRSASIIDCTEDQASIRAAIEKALNPAFLKIAKSADYPFGTPGVAVRIKETLVNTDFSNILLKRFYDLPTGVNA
jgi:UDP-hydrolysing UDP-N-acetyl-D-glucosamine 2-epimerase